MDCLEEDNFRVCGGVEEEAAEDAREEATETLEMDRLSLGGARRVLPQFAEGKRSCFVFF